MPLSHAASSTAQASSSLSSRNRLPTFAAPYPSRGIAANASGMRTRPRKFGATGGLHFHARARLGRRHVRAALNIGRHDEVLMQVVDEFDQAPLAGAGDGNEVEHRQV